MGCLEQTAFSEGTKVSLKFLGVLCNASCWQIWKIPVKSLSRKRPFVSKREFWVWSGKRSIC